MSGIKKALVVAVGVSLLSPLLGLSSWAARKYYPPGFKPPADQTLIPVSPAVDTTPKAPVGLPQPVGGKQVIIKTVPVTVEKMVTVQAKPKDPLMVLMEQHRHFDALRLLDERLNKSPNNVTLQLYRGETLRDQGAFDKALEQYSVLLDKNHSKVVRADAQNGIGWTFYEKALHERQMGNLMTGNTSLHSAEMAFRQSTSLAPQKPYAWSGLGEVALVNNQLSAAEFYIKKANKLGPTLLVTQLATADLLLAQKRPEEALQILYGIKKMTTREPDVYVLLARASLDVGKVDDAIINLKQLLELEPDHTEALKLLSLSYERKMKPEDAEVALEKAISLNPMDVKSVTALLRIYEQRGESDRMILVLKTLLKDHPGQGVYGLALLELLAKQGRWDEVVSEGAGIIQANPVMNHPEQAVTGNPAFSQSEQAMAMQAWSQDGAIVSVFSRAVYQTSRGLLDRHLMAQDAAVAKAQHFAQVDLAQSTGSNEDSVRMMSRLSLLLIDATATVPPLPANWQPSALELSSAIQVAFLQGDQQHHLQWLTQQAKDLPGSLIVARQLYNLGDYTGALRLLEFYLAKVPADANAHQLRAKITDDQNALTQQLTILKMLPRRMPDHYWQKTASEILQLGPANGEAYAVVGIALEKRHHPELALVQMRLAVKYAPTLQDRERWTRQMKKISHNVARNQGKHSS